MGRLSSAKIFYGLDFDENNDANIILSNDPEEKYTIACGFPKPTIPYDAFDNHAVYCVFWKKKRELIDISGCEVDLHGYEDEPRYFIAIKSSITTVYQGDVKTVVLAEVQSDWDLKIKDFCDKIGVQYSQPSWKLVSYYG